MTDKTMSLLKIFWSTLPILMRLFKNSCKFAFPYHPEAEGWRISFLNFVKTANFSLEVLIKVIPFKIKGIQTDNGSRFLGEFTKALKKKDIKHYFNYPKYPKGQAYVREWIGHYKKSLRCAIKIKN